MSLFENPLKRLADFESLEESIKKEKFPVQVSDMSEPGKAHLISELMKEEKAWKLVISYDEDNAGRLYEDIGCRYKIFTDNSKKSGSLETFKRR